MTVEIERALDVYYALHKSCAVYSILFNILCMHNTLQHMFTYNKLHASNVMFLKTKLGDNFMRCIDTHYGS